MKKIVLLGVIFFYAICSFSCALVFPYKKYVPTEKIAERTDKTVTIHFCCDVTDKIGFNSLVIGNEDIVDEIFPNGKLKENLKVKDLRKYFITSKYDVFLGSAFKKTIYGCYKFEVSKLTGTLDKKFAFIGEKTFMSGNSSTSYYSVYGIDLSLKPGEYYYMLKYASSNSASGYELIEITQADFVKDIEPRIIGYGIPKSDNIEGWVYSE